MDHCGAGFQHELKPGPELRCTQWIRCFPQLHVCIKIVNSFVLLCCKTSLTIVCNTLVIKKIYKINYIFLRRPYSDKRARWHSEVRFVMRR